jgi:Core-2/I-Branching enzyme
MAKIAFIILAHNNIADVADLAWLLTEGLAGAHAVIHLDLNTPASEFVDLKRRVADQDRVHVIDDRVRCAWGAYGLVDAPLWALKFIQAYEIDCERVMMVSGACMPIQPLADLSHYLDQHPEAEFIECDDERWIRGGIRHQRYQYRHFFRFQTHYRLFRWNYLIQRRIFPARRFIADLEPRWGSQWWCLTSTLCKKITALAEARPDIRQFFKTTWIPDEMFFQTLAYKLVPPQNLTRRTLTYFEFNSSGKPRIFSDGDEDYLTNNSCFFARKISSGAKDLRSKLRSIALGDA